MTSNDLQQALEGLGTERLQRLVDGLARDPDVKLTIGAWRPQCPMVLAGFNPSTAASNTPEHRFAGAWDRFAKPEARRWVLLPAGRRTARQADVQFLLRTASAVLARRASSGYVGLGRSSSAPTRSGSLAKPDAAS